MPGRKKPVPRLDAIEQLDLFLEQAAELKRRRLTQTGFQGSLTIDSNTRATPGVWLGEIDEEDLRSYLTTLRPFISDGEPVFLDIVIPLGLRHLTNPDDRDLMKRAGRLWRGIKKSRYMVVTIGTRKLLPREVFDLYVNGRIFHVRDRQKAALLKQVDDPRLPLARWIATHYMIDVHNLVAVVASTINGAKKAGALAAAPVASQPLK